MKRKENIEVELKFPIDNPKEIVKKLTGLAGSPKEEYQKDIYFNSTKNNFLEKKPIKEWLRIRESKENITLNHKRWHDNKEDKSVSCDEHEVKVSDAKVCNDILKGLGFKELIIVEKKRKAWEYKGTKIALDNVNNLGDFIEIESKDSKDIETIKNHLYSLIDELSVSVGKQDFKGYPYRVLENKGLLR